MGSWSPEGVDVSLPVVILIGAGIGFAGGLLGKGGAAMATPLLMAVGVPPAVALAAPLPATVPGTLVAASRYQDRGLIRWDVVKWSILAGAPATILGAFLTRWIDARGLVLVTDLVLIAIGVHLVRAARSRRGGPAVADLDPAATGEILPAVEVDTARVVAVAAITGLAAGLLANGGGFLLAPLFMAVLGMAVKPALGTSLAVASALAVPGTAVHLLLGHLDVAVVLAFAAGSVPLSSLGAKVALRSDPTRLETGYGIALVVLGSAFLLTA